MHLNATKSDPPVILWLILSQELSIGLVPTHDVTQCIVDKKKNIQRIVYAPIRTVYTVIHLRAKYTTTHQKHLYSFASSFFFRRFYFFALSRFIHV